VLPFRQEGRVDAGEMLGPVLRLIGQIHADIGEIVMPCRLVAARKRRRIQPKGPQRHIMGGPLLLQRDTPVGGEIVDLLLPLRVHPDRALDIRRERPIGPNLGIEQIVP
jgi:hypothetical protein